MPIDKSLIPAGFAVTTVLLKNSHFEPRPNLLNDALEVSNIRAVACPKGQVMGQDNDVRVFDIQHIKGLEFEAVFFIGIDRLAAEESELFDKYLYVGTTREATYLWSNLWPSPATRHGIITFSLSFELVTSIVEGGRFHDSS